jgi:PIN domain nuclease of toxin-antitoxin system
MGRPEVILLDTHAAIWFVRDDPALGKRSRALALEALSEERLSISAISFWEMAFLIKKRRLRSLKDPAEQRQLMIRAGFQELPLSGDISILAVQLDGLHTDPADRLIAATALVHDATLMTADETLLKWRSKVRRFDAER